MTRQFSTIGITALALGGACSGSNGAAPDGSYQTLPSGYTLVSTGESGANDGAAPGDPIQLSVVIGANTALGPTANVSWYGPPLVVAVTSDAAGLPAFGNIPTAILLQLPASDAGGRVVPASVANTLFVLDPGTGVDANGASFPISINALVTDPQHNAGAPLPWDAGGLVPGSVATALPLVGDADAGGFLFAESCAKCHGAGGEGLAAADGGVSAPGLNAEAGNLADNAAWTQGLFVFATLVGVDETGLVIQDPMPIYLDATNPLTHQPFTNQDLSNVYAWLLTQTCTPAGDASVSGTGSDCCSGAIDASGECTTPSATTGTTGGSVTTGGSTGTTVGAGTSGSTAAGATTTTGASTTDGTSTSAGATTTTGATTAGASTGDTTGSTTGTSSGTTTG